ncbi:hypothetical protein ECG581_4121 [Escherichia coli G58-1]|nr:hypothetical protein ECG581_4121 [Escherichia coli G58-1]
MLLPEGSNNITNDCFHAAKSRNSFANKGYFHNFIPAKSLSQII